MFALVSLLCFAAAIGVDRWNLRRAVFRRFPYDSLSLLTLAAAAGYLSMSREGGILSTAVFTLTGAALAAFVVYLLVGSRFPRTELARKVGDNWPRFELPDSEGNRFDSASLLEKNAALYLFYRGDW